MTRIPVACGRYLRHLDRKLSGLELRMHATNAINSYISVALARDRNSIRFVFLTDVRTSVFFLYLVLGTC